MGFLPNLAHALTLRRSGLGLLMGKFRQMLTESSARNTIMAGYYRFVFIYFEIAVFYICYFCTYRIRPNYRTVRLGFSKLLGTLRCDKICTYTY